MKEDITSEQLMDRDEHVQCECGNMTIHDYSWQDYNGEYNNCPICMVDWMTVQVRIMKELVYDLSKLSKEETANAINEKYAEQMCVKVSDFIEDYDFSRLDKIRK